MSIKGFNTIVPLDLFAKKTATDGAPGVPGTLVQGEGGQKYRLAYFAESIPAGHLVQSPAIVTDFEGLVVAGTDPVKAGENSFGVVLGATGVNTDELKGDKVAIINGNGEGHIYTIVSNTQASPAGTTTVTIEGALAKDLLGGTTQVSIVKNDYNGVVKAPTTLTGSVVGVTVVDVSAGDYAWVQTAGDASVLADGAVAQNATFGPSATVSGAVAAGQTPVVGVAKEALVDTEFRVAKLTLE